MMTATDADALQQQLHDAVAFVRSCSAVRPDVALILGTGLGRLGDSIDVECAVDFADIPHMPPSTVESHAGRMLFGRLAGRPVVAMQGRYHGYEGHALQAVVLPVRLMRALGADTLVLSGACGSMNPLWAAGELVLLSDHINLLGDNPLVGPNVDSWGARFPDMSEPYDNELQMLARQVAVELRIPLREGVYAAVAGPNLETRAEYRMLRALGADVVGMSTVPEVIAARHMGMRVLAVSIITDVCLPDALEATDIDTIIRTAAAAEPSLARLLSVVLDGTRKNLTAAPAAVAGGKG
jgi:purine-nucleoside phosphorylase